MLNYVELIELYSSIVGYNVHRLWL